MKFVVLLLFVSAIYSVNSKSILEAPRHKDSPEQEVVNQKNPSKPKPIVEYILKVLLPDPNCSCNQNAKEYKGSDEQKRSFVVSKQEEYDDSTMIENPDINDADTILENNKDGTKEVAYDSLFPIDSQPDFTINALDILVPQVEYLPIAFGVNSNLRLLLQLPFIQRSYDCYSKDYYGAAKYHNEARNLYLVTKPS